MSQPVPETLRWQGFTHQQLYKLLHEGAGPKASAEPSRRWAELESTLNDIGQDLRQAIDRTGSGWSGRAAGAAYDRLAPLVYWAETAASNAGEMRVSVENQAEHLARARADMPAPDGADPATAAPPPDPAAAVVAAGQDKEPVEAAASTGAQRAFEVMAAYQRSTDTNTGAMASFAAPGELNGTFEIYRGSNAGVAITTPVASVNVAVGPPPGRKDDGDDDDHPGRGNHRGDLTEGAFAEAVEVRRPPMQAPSSFTVAAPLNEPLFGLGTIGGPVPGGGSGSSRGGGRTSSLPVGSGGAPVHHHSSGLGLGSPSAGAAGIHSADFQSAAAGQAAAAAGSPAAAAPGAAAGPGYGNSQDAKTMRRLGAEVIGSGQWFDANEPDSESVRGASPNRRRREFRDDHVTESVSIDGQEHRLPPNVIGD
jgi:hypothetical protein